MDQVVSRRRKQKSKSANRGLGKMLPDFNCKSLTGLGRQVVDQMRLVVPTTGFFKDSLRFMKRCTKPNRKEFRRTCVAIAIGFFVMGTIGFLVKLMHIPITNIIMG